MALNDQFSVVCATKFGGTTLANLYRSICENDCKPCVFICVGSAETDFEPLVESFQACVPFLIVSSLTSGQVVQRNVGLSIVDKGLVFQLDDDLTLDISYFRKMLNHFNSVDSEKKIVGAVPRFYDHEPMSLAYSKLLFNKNYFIDLAFRLTNQGRRFRPLSLAASGRNIPGIEFDDEDSKYIVEWLCSCMLYDVTALTKAKNLTGRFRKAHFEDVIFSYSLFCEGYKLSYCYEAFAFHPREQNRAKSLKELLDIFRAQAYVVRVFNLSKLCFFMDMIIFSVAQLRKIIRVES